VDLLPGPAPSFPPGRMRPRKAVMTTRPSPQLLSSQRRASLRDGLYFPGFRGPLSFRGSLCARYLGADFAARHGKCCLLAGSSPIQPESTVEPGVLQLFFAGRSAKGPQGCSLTGLPTKVDLHVHGITSRSKIEDLKRRKVRTKPRRCGHSPRSLSEGANSPCGLPSLFHSIAFQIPDLRAWRE